MSLRPPPSQLPQRLAVGLAVGALLAATGCGARFDTSATARGAATGDQLSADQGATPADTGITDAGTTDAGTTDARSAGTGADPGGLTDGGGTSTAPAAGGGTKASHAPKAQRAPASAGSQFGIEGKTVKICYLFAKSGSAPLPPNVEDAMDAYWEFVNTKKGGLNGFKVDPEVCDTQSTVAGAQAAVQKAIDIKAFAVTTLDRLALDAVMAERLWKAGIPNIALLNAPDPDPKWKDQTFFISTDQGVVGRMVAKYFQARKFKDVAVVSEASDANNEKVIKPFLQEAPKRGQKIVSDDIRLDTSNSSGYSTQCAQLAAKNPKAVWLYTAPTPAIQFVNACGSFKPVWFSSELAWDMNIAPAAAPGLRGAEGFGRWATLSETARIAPFKKAFNDYVASGRSRGGETGSTKTLQDLALLAWGESQVLANGIFNASKSPVGLGRDSFINAMRNLKLGATSPADGTPLLWAPMDFTGGKFFGGAEITSVWKVSSGAEAIWERVSGYQTEF